MTWNQNFDAETNTYDLGGGYILKNLHKPYQCAGDLCIIHNVTQGPTKDWPLTYRLDRGIFERHCIHGIGHPAVEQLEFWRVANRGSEAVHGCCGVCNCFEVAE